VCAFEFYDFMVFVLGSKVTGAVVRIVDDYRSFIKFMRLEGLGGFKKQRREKVVKQKCLDFKE
jgi:hypothetical protein